MKIIYAILVSVAVIVLLPVGIAVYCALISVQALTAFIVYVFGDIHIGTPSSKSQSVG